MDLPLMAILTVLGLTVLLAVAMAIDRYRAKKHAPR